MQENNFMPKSVVTEYERKFLIKKLPDNINLKQYEYIEIEQIYLSDLTDALCTRIRVETKKGQSRYYMMMKSGGLKSHLEWTKEISGNEYCDLVKFQGDSIRINKTRYNIPTSNPEITIELDIFHDNLDGLMVAEVENTTGNHSIIDNYKPEPWFDTEVTHDKRFYNVSLAYKFKKPHRNFLLNFYQKIKQIF